MKRRIYIAGPMRGYPEHNIPAFRAAAARLRGLGHDVVSPVEVSEANGHVEQSSRRAEEWVRDDLVELLTCNAIALLPGWEASTGARCEAAVAVTLDFAFFDANGFHLSAPERITIAGGYNRPPGRVDTLESLLDEVRAWRRVTFPHSSRHSCAVHLAKEAKELQAEPDSDEEVADVQMLVSGFLDNEGIIRAVRRKLEINKARTWGEPDADGVVYHVADGAEVSA